MDTALQLRFDVSDGVTADDLAPMLTDLREGGAEAEVQETHEQAGMFGVVEVVALVAVGVWGVSQLTKVLAFCQRALHKGVVVDLTTTPPTFSKDRDLPRGDVVILRSDSPPEYCRGLSVERVAEMLDEVARSSDPTRFGPSTAST
ncbi:MAG: hypothetical protein WBG89_10740 [Ornithinimicrobium sp.]